MVAEFEADLIRMKVQEGMAVAKAKGRLRGKRPTLSASRRKHSLELHDKSEHTQAELQNSSASLAQPFTVSCTDDQTRRRADGTMRRLRT